MKKSSPRREPSRPLDPRELARATGGSGFLDSGPSDANRVLERNETGTGETR
jgi:hypothetical protein